MFWQILILSISNLRANKLRSFLTMLGVVIAILSFIFIVAIISGLNAVVNRQVSSLGSNIVTVSRLPGFAGRQLTDEEKERKELTLDEAEVVREEARDVELVTCILPLDFGRFPNPNVHAGSVHAQNVKVFGVEPDYINVYISNIRYGRFITGGDVEHRTKVMVLGATVADTMFPGEDPVGKSIYFENDAFDIVGVLAPRGSIFGFDRDNFVWLPVTTMLKLHPESKDGLTIAMRATSEQAIPRVQDQVTEIMRRARHDPYDKPNSFDIGGQNQFLEFYQQLTFALYLTLVVVGSIGLLVGGIGVMNIMLV